VELAPSRPFGGRAFLELLGVGDRTAGSGGGIYFEFQGTASAPQPHLLTENRLVLTILHQRRSPQQSAYPPGGAHALRDSRSPFAHRTFGSRAAHGCGGSSDYKSCSDACNNLFNCAAKLDFTPSTYLGSDYQTLSSCISHCPSGTCPNQQALINCGANVQCNSLNQVETDTENCFSNAQCTP